MSKLYYKSEIWFSVLWIVIYVVGTSAADIVSKSIGFEKSISFVFHLFMSLVILVWIRKNKLFSEYGLCKPGFPASKFLYYIPLVFLASCNLWLGVKSNYPLLETLFYIGSMLCVGFLEEIIFRGFLFKAMSKDNLRSAIIVSSLTFGIGHIVNLFNGSGAELLSNICQVCYAVAFGFLFVIIFIHSKSLIPCIITHSVINSMSVFANESNVTVKSQIAIALILTITALAYSFFIVKANAESI